MSIPPERVVAYLVNTFPGTQWQPGTFYLESTLLPELSTLVGLLDQMEIDEPLIDDEDYRLTIASTAVKAIVATWTRGATAPLKAAPDTNENPVATLVRVLTNIANRRFGRGDKPCEMMAQILDAQLKTGYLRDVQTFRSQLARTARAAIDVGRNLQAIEENRFGYRLNMKGLWLLAKKGGRFVTRAQQQLQICDTLLSGPNKDGGILAHCYRSDPKKAWAVPEIASAAGLADESAASALRFLVDLTIGSWERDAEELLVSITLYEQVLDASSVDDAVRAWGWNEQWESVLTPQQFQMTTVLGELEEDDMADAASAKPSDELLNMVGSMVVGDKPFGKFRGSDGAPIFAQAGWVTTTTCPGTGWETWASEQLRLFLATDAKAIEKLLTAMAAPSEFLDSGRRLKQSEREGQIKAWNGFLAPHGLQIIATESGASVEFTPPRYLPAEGSELPTRPKATMPEHVVPPRKPRLFIGSSAEGLSIAEAIHVALDYDAECTIWSQGVFGLSKGNLENLVENAGRFDFAVLVLTPDDVTTKRNKAGSSPRDNVLFELGLFIGKLGRERTYMAYCRNDQLELPTDLAGIAAATFGRRSDDNLHAAVSPACVAIKTHMKRVGLREGIA